MKDYIKFCIREKDPAHVIIHVVTNELDFQRQPEMIEKSITDVATKIKK